MNPADLLHAIPYCRHLGARGEVKDGVLTLVMPFAPHLIGNMTIPALHGGVIASLLETAAIAQLAWETSSAGLPKPVDIAIDYLRTAWKASRAAASPSRAGGSFTFVPRCGRTTRANPSPPCAGIS